MFYQEQILKKNWQIFFDLFMPVVKKHVHRWRRLLLEMSEEVGQRPDGTFSRWQSDTINS